MTDHPLGGEFLELTAEEYIDKAIEFWDEKRETMGSDTVNYYISALEAVKATEPGTTISGAEFEEWGECLEFYCQQEEFATIAEGLVDLLRKNSDLCSDILIDGE